MTPFPPVSVGQTDVPLKPCPLQRGPLPFSPPAPGAPSWRLLDGPPYANGAPHLGHVLNKHLKDAVARACHARGFAVDWRPGWDCHGLPLELAVEKEGVRRRDRGPFLAAARAYAGRQVAVQRTVFEAQGWAADWERPWHTMDPAQESGTLHVLATLLERGALEVRDSAVPWCPRCQSTLSGAEQEEAFVEADTWLAPFRLDDAWLLSWTTTPWTLPLHRGLVVHPTAAYQPLVLPNGQRAWVSAETAEEWASVLSAHPDGPPVSGATFEGREYATPWGQGVVAADARVVPGAGTGVLHAVPGLADLDTHLGAAFGWGTRQHLSPDGRVENSPLETQNGHPAGAALEAVAAAYAGWPLTQGLRRRWAVPHCWRHKTPLLTRFSRQVFLGLSDGMRRRVGDWVEALAFTPEAARSRLRAATTGRPDWCLSRQRTWGVPVALFLDARTGLPHPRASVWMRRVADAVAVEGVEAWWTSPSERWLQGEAALDGLVRVDDVLDVWFDSGCVPQLVGPADTVVEGTDQHRGWFQSCMWVAAALGQDAPPFRRVVSHGFVVDAKGQKLSKSQGGDRVALDKPAAKRAVAWDTLPTDVVRTWALSGSEGADKAWTVDTVREAAATMARWRGVARFLVANRLAPSQRNDTAPLVAWDRWWWWHCQQEAAAVVALVAEGRTGEAVSRALAWGESFSAVALGSWKDRLYCAPASTFERQAVDRALRGCLAAWMTALSVLAPRLAHDLAPQGVEPTPALDRPPTEGEARDVAAVLAARTALAPTAERLAQAKVPPSRRRVEWLAAPAWPEGLLADALDVAQVGRQGDLEATETLDPVCPRCRRAQPAWEGSCCRRCQERTSADAGAC